MRAWELTEPAGPRALALVERPDPAPGPTDVVVRVDAVSLNYRDLLMVPGRYSRKVPGRHGPVLRCGRRRGRDGGRRAHVKVGDRVTSMFAPEWTAGQFIAARPRVRPWGPGTAAGVPRGHGRAAGSGVLPPPSHLTQVEAATLPCAGLTAWHALLEETPIGPGDVGADARLGRRIRVRRAVRACARARGSSPPPATPRRPSGCGRSASNRSINYREIAAWGDAVRAAAGGEGVDHVVEVGGAGHARAVVDGRAAWAARSASSACSLAPRP